MRNGYKKHYCNFWKFVNIFFINEDFLKNTDLAGHLIVPENNEKGNNIIKFLKQNIDIN